MNVKYIYLKQKYFWKACPWFLTVLAASLSIFKEIPRSWRVLSTCWKFGNVFWPYIQVEESRYILLNTLAIKALISEQEISEILVLHSLMTPEQSGCLLTSELKDSKRERGCEGQSVVKTSFQSWSSWAFSSLRQRRGTAYSSAREWAQCNGGERLLMSSSDAGRSTGRAPPARKICAGTNEFLSDWLWNQSSSFVLNGPQCNFCMC